MYKYLYVKQISRDIVYRISKGGRVMWFNINTPSHGWMYATMNDVEMSKNSTSQSATDISERKLRAMEIPCLVPLSTTQKLAGKF